MEKKSEMGVHCGLVTPMMAYNCVNIGQGNALLPDSTKPLPKTLLAYHKGVPVEFKWG